MLTSARISPGPYGCDSCDEKMRIVAARRGLKRLSLCAACAIESYWHLLPDTGVNHESLLEAYVRRRAGLVELNDAVRLRLILDSSFDAKMPPSWPGPVNKKLDALQRNLAPLNILYLARHNKYAGYQAFYCHQGPRRNSGTQKKYLVLLFALGVILAHDTVAEVDKQIYTQKWFIEPHEPFVHFGPIDPDTGGAFHNTFLIRRRGQDRHRFISWYFEKGLQFALKGLGKSIEKDPL